MVSYLKQLFIPFCFRPQTSMSPHQVNTQPPGFNGMLRSIYDFCWVSIHGPLWCNYYCNNHELIAIRLELLKPPCGKVLLVKCNNQPFAKHGTSWEIDKLDHQNHGKLKTFIIGTHESKTNISPSCFVSNCFFCMLVLIIIYHWQTPHVSATEIYHTWITFIIHNTSLGYVTTLREYPSHPFEGNRFPTDFPDSNGRMLPPRVKLMVDWTTHLNQNMPKWRGLS